MTRTKFSNQINHLPSSLQIIGGPLSKVFTSAIIVQPPVDQWTQIQDIRKKHDKAYERWMPHINLIFPFVPEAAMQGVLPQLQSAMSKIAPFVVTLHDFCHFNHGNSNTIYLEPKTDELQSAIEAVFPFCNEQSSKSEGGFTPHLTVGQANSVTRDKNIGNFRKTYKQISWKLALTLKGDTPFQVKYTVSLGASGCAPVAPTPTPPSYAEYSALPIAPLAAKPVEVEEISDLDRVTDKVESWLKQMQTEKLPKSPDKLEKSMKPLCICQISVMTVDEALEYLKGQGYITIESKGEVRYNIPSSHVNTTEFVRYKHGASSKEFAYARLNDWVSKEQNAPKTLEKLKNSLVHLTVAKITVPPRDVVDNLVQKGVIQLSKGSGWDNETLEYTF